jgi:ribosomal subunit interface protein
MRIEARGIHLDLTEALTAHVEHRLGRSLDHFDGRVDHVSVRLTSSHGPKGVPRMQCHVEVDLAGLGTVIVEHSQADIYTAVDKAAGRLKRAVRRQINRRRDTRRERDRTPLRVAVA